MSEAVALGIFGVLFAGAIAFCVYATARKDGTVMITPSISALTATLALEVHERRASPRVGAAGSDDDIRFLALSMAGEAGEAANVVKKAWRDGGPVNREKLAEEIAGTACYLIGLAAAIGLDLDNEMVAQMRAFEARYTPSADGERAPEETK